MKHLKQPIWSADLCYWNQIKLLCCGYYPRCILSHSEHHETYKHSENYLCFHTFNYVFGNIGECLLDHCTLSSPFQLVLSVQFPLFSFHSRVWSPHHSVTLGHFTHTCTFNLPHTPGDGTPGPGAENLVHTVLPVQRYMWKKYTSSINRASWCKIFPTELLHTQMNHEAL